MSLSPESIPPRRPLLNRLGWLIPLAMGASVGLVLRLLYTGRPDGPYEPMMRSFILLVPPLVGALAVYIAERNGPPRGAGAHFWIGFGANVLLILGSVLTTLEGVICAFLALPIFSTFGGVAGMIMGAVCRRTRRADSTLFGIAALPLLFGAVEQRFPLPQDVTSTERTVMVSVPPEALWPQLVNAANIRPDEMGSAWMYRIGVPLPSSATTRMIDGTPVRHITMGKGIHFDQVAADWEPNHRVRWLYRFSADSFPPQALDDHVRIGGRYFDLIDTEYSLRRIPEGTEFRVRMSYRVSTAFNWYARPLATLLVGDFEKTALAFYTARAQAVVAAR